MSVEDIKTKLPDFLERSNAQNKLLDPQIHKYEKAIEELKIS
jgi:hypothetical protein